MSPARQTLTHQSSILIAGERVKVSILAMKRKTLRLGITEQGEIEVKMPLRCPKSELMAFLNQHTPWLEQRLESFHQLQQQRQKQMRYLGGDYHFAQSEQQSKEPILIAQTCYIPNHWSEQERLGKVEAWQRKEAKQIFQRLIDHWWPHFAHGALINKPVLRVKKIRSRWGSLSSKGYINLNLKLTELPIEIIEMVVVHELCHSHHMDHSQNFYRLMADKLPNYKQLERQLKQIEQGLAY